MASRRTKVVLNIPGWDELRTSPEMEKLVSDTAQGVADRAGEGFLVAVHLRKKQVVANVYPSTAHAMAREAKYGLLSKALGGVAVVTPERVRYRTKAGKTRWASPAQVKNWTRRSN